MLKAYDDFGYCFEAREYTENHDTMMRFHAEIDNVVMQADPRLREACTEQDNTDRAIDIRVRNETLKHMD